MNCGGQHHINSQVLAVVMTQSSVAMVSLGLWSYWPTVSFEVCNWMKLYIMHDYISYTHGQWSTESLELCSWQTGISSHVGFHSEFCLFIWACSVHLTGNLYPTSVWQIFPGMQNMAASAGHLCLHRDSLHWSKQELQACFKVPWVFLQWKF